VTDVDQRARTAFHESGHAVAAVAQGIPVEAASLRPGRGFHGLTLLGLRGDIDREEEERRLVGTLAGDVGGLFAEPLAGHPDPEAERVAVEALEHRSPSAFVRLMEAEVAEDVESDEVIAERVSWRLSGYDKWIAAAHLQYLRRRALRTVESHRHALRQLAAELYQRTVVDGAEIDTIARAYRCVCHSGWGRPSALAPGTPGRKEPTVSILKRKPKAPPVAAHVAPVDSSATRLPGPIPLSRRVRATRTGLIGYFLVTAGELSDAEHYIVKRNPAYFEPTPEPDDPEAA
jgi:hypothetical protein